MTSFNKLGLPDIILDSLKKINFTNPTPIQEQAIPAASTGMIFSVRRKPEQARPPLLLFRCWRICSIRKARRLWYCSPPANLPGRFVKRPKNLSAPSPVFIRRYLSEGKQCQNSCGSLNTAAADCRYSGSD